MSEDQYRLCPRCGAELVTDSAATGVNTGKGLVVRGAVLRCDRCEVCFTRGVSGPVAGFAVYD